MNTFLSEWVKLRSVRSTWLIAFSTIFAGVALSILGVSDLIGTAPADLPADWDPTANSLKGFLFAQLLIGMLGAISMTSEHDTGMIGTSLSIVPFRPRLLLAKAATVGLVALITSLATTLISFTVVQLILNGSGFPAAELADPGVLVALVGAVLYLVLIALLGLAIGTLTRSTTSSLAVLVGGTLLVPAIAPGLPVLGGWFASYWPITAGQAAYAVVAIDGMVPQWLGLSILAATAIVAGAASVAALQLRDI